MNTRWGADPLNSLQDRFGAKVPPHQQEVCDGVLGIVVLVLAQILYP